MKAYLIDPIGQSITEVQTDGQLDSILELTQSQLIASLIVDDFHVLYAAAIGTPATAGKFNLILSSVYFGRAVEEVHGRGLLVRVNKNGDPMDIQITPDEARAKVAFPETSPTLVSVGA